MAYIDRVRSSPSRPYVVTGVALLHVAAGYALVSGLGVSYIKEVTSVFEAHNVPLEPSPPPPPKPLPSPQAQETRVTAPKSQIVVLPTGNRPIADVVLPPIPPMPETRLVPIDPPPPPRPSLVPRSAQPRGNPGLWATTEDYPARDLREGNEGRAGFTLAIGTDGRVQSCAITSTSGFPGLDRATCEKVSRRARFEPATDGAGNRIPGSYTGSVTWRMPPD